MRTVSNILSNRKSPFAYASDEIYETLAVLIDLPIGTRVRLVGETPDDIGAHWHEGWVVVMEADAMIAQWMGIRRDDIRLVE